jgi:hypothetical protein
MDLTYGINPNQEVAGMVADYNKREALADATVAQEAEASRKENMEPNRDAALAISKGRLNPSTGVEIPMTPKARKIASWVPSSKFIQNFDQIRWNK